MHTSAEHTPLSAQTNVARMRSRRKPRSRLSSENAMHAAGSLVDEELASTIQSSDDYELAQPTTSQNLFDSRLAMAGRSGSASSTLTKSNELELNVFCSPGQFQLEWESLQTGLTFTDQIRNIPTLSGCHKHFNERNYHVVGSGLAQEDTKIYLVAQISGALSRSRCLVEITFNSTRYEMHADVRCTNQDEARYFLSALELKSLFNY